MWTTKLTQLYRISGERFGARRISVSDKVSSSNNDSCVQDLAGCFSAGFPGTGGYFGGGCFLRTMGLWGGPS